MTEPKTPSKTPRGFRRAWLTTYRRTDRSDYPHLHFVGVKGRVGLRFFDLSLGWGKKHNKCHLSTDEPVQPPRFEPWKATRCPLCGGDRFVGHDGPICLNQDCEEGFVPLRERMRRASANPPSRDS